MLIYMIRSKCGSHIYIGSCVDFYDRIRTHKSYYYNQKSAEYYTKKYKIMRDCGGWTNFDMKIIDVVTTSDKSVLKLCEQYYIDKYDATNSMNIFNAVRNKNEYQREYRDINRVRRNNQSKNRSRWKVISRQFRAIEPIYP